MSHDNHEAEPGYSSEQILFDGCAECADRAAREDLGIGSLDRETFMRAWQRAERSNREGLPDASMTERRLLRALWAVRCQLESALPIYCTCGRGMTEILTTPRRFT